MPKRIRVLVYTHASQADLEKQRAHDTVRHVWGTNRIESWELDPRRITLMELVRLWWREGRHRG
jgi:hypothetical protein